MQDCLDHTRFEKRLSLEINHLFLQTAQHQGRSAITGGLVIDDICVVNVLVEQLQQL